MARTDDGDQIEVQLLRRERERIDALVGDNMERFAALLADDLVHVHTKSVVQGKAELLQHAGGLLQFVQIERGPLKVRVLAPTVAVMTGPMTNTVRRRGHEEVVTIEAYVTQVWVDDGDDWKIASFHAVRIQDNPFGTPTTANEESKRNG